jgi:VIT1/CCC1 family predicted Fe2+/Mn2+ transporter
MAGAYGAGALAPLAAFGMPGLGSGAVIALAVIITGAGLFALGVLKARVSGTGSVRSGLELLTLASAAGVAGYLIGAVARALFDITFAAPAAASCSAGVILSAAVKPQ